MPVSLYEITIPVFIRSIKIVQLLIKKGLESEKSSSDVLIKSKLVEDMGDFIFQIQRISDTAKGVSVRIGKAEPVALADTEKTFEDVQARLEATLKILESVKPENVDESSEVTLPSRAGPITMSAKSYVINYAVPNFYFHFMVVYALLRKEGVDVGKNDFLGRTLPEQDQPSLK